MTLLTPELVAAAMDRSEQFPWQPSPHLLPIGHPDRVPDEQLPAYVARILADHPLTAPITPAALTEATALMPAVEATR